MKNKLILTYCAGCVSGIALGIGAFFLFNRDATRIDTKAQLISLAKNHSLDENEYNWNEYKNGNWHVAAMWSNGNTSNPAEVFLFKKHQGEWHLASSNILSRSDDQLDHVKIVYPDRCAMLIDNQGLLIESMIFDSVEEER